jgi:cytochrome P450
MPESSPASGTTPALYPPAARPAEGVLPLIQYFARFIRNPLIALPKQVFEEPMVTTRYAGKDIAWVAAPALLEAIFLKENERFAKAPLERRVFKPSLGEGILTSEGAEWRWQRKTAAPLFRHGELLEYVPIMTETAREQLQRWRSLAPGTTTDIEADMTATTFDVVSRTVLAGCNARDGAIIQRAGRAFLDHITWSITYATLGVPEWIWHPGKRRMLEAARDERAAVARLVAGRLKDPHPGDDLLSRLLAARHPDSGERMSEARLVDNLLTFLAAGHETTAKALTWALYLLARAPEWQERVRDEAIAVAGGRALTGADIEKLAVTQRVIKETMRLYPPAPVLTRVAADDITLGEHAIANGTLVVIPIYAVHRHRAYWDDPDRFDPDRFLPAREADRPRAQFMPFGYGPRTCIGAAFAMIEATAILATLIRGARFAWDGSYEPEPQARVTLRPRGGMPLKVTLLDGSGRLNAPTLRAHP